MVASMFRLFGYWEFGKRAGGSTAQLRLAAPTAYCEALLASWVPLLPEIRAAAGPDKPLTKEAKSDVQAFLERVYRNQQC
jgi:hypothetical protein